MNSRPWGHIVLHILAETLPVLSSSAAQSDFILSIAFMYFFVFLHYLFRTEASSLSSA